MRFACVFNPFRYKLLEENLKIVQRYFGLFPPLSMAWVYAIAEKAEHDALLIDARTLCLTKEDVLDRLKEWKPDILFRHILQVKSWGEFKRKFFAFIEMVFRQERVSALDENFVVYPENKGNIFSYKKNSRWGTPF